MSKLKIKSVAMVIIVIVLAMGLSACGGGKSIPTGKYESDGSGSFTYFDFKSGGKVEVSSGFEIEASSKETVKYTWFGCQKHIDRILK